MTCPLQKARMCSFNNLTVVPPHLNIMKGDTKKMKFGYADPPYFGNGKSKYGYPEWDTKERHIELIKYLIESFPDGWVLCCNPKDLVWLLPHCPEGTRVCAWCKTFHQIRPTTVQYAWEPVIFYGGRKENGRKPMIRDWMACARTNRKGLQGAKPILFNEWVLRLLNFKKGDKLIDLFPGTGGMGEVVIKWQV